MWITFALKAGLSTFQKKLSTDIMRYGVFACEKVYVKICIKFRIFSGTFDAGQE